MLAITRRIGCSQTDAKARLSLKGAVDLMQDCSLFQLDSEKELSRYFRENNVGMYLVSRQIDCIRMPEYGEEITTKTWVYECKAAYGFRNTVLYDERGKACVVTYATGAFVNLQTGRPVRMPRDVINTVPMEERAEMEYLPRKIKVPACAPMDKLPFKVLNMHADLNGHVNNAMYLAFAEEYLERDAEIKRVRVEYRNPAKPGEWIVPQIYQEENRMVAELLNQARQSFAIVEFCLEKSG